MFFKGVPLLLVLVLFCVGCGSDQTGSVKGVVKYNGTPTGGFEVTFIPTGDGPDAMGFTKANGEFILIKGRGDTQIPTGEYKVTVSPSDQIEGVPKPEVKLPRTVTARDATTIVKTVVKGENKIDIELQ